MEAERQDQWGRWSAQQPAARDPKHVHVAASQASVSRGSCCGLGSGWRNSVPHFWGLAPWCSWCAVCSPAQCRCHQSLSVSSVGGVGVHSHMGPLCFEERSSASLTASQGTQLQRGKREMLILKKSKHVTSAGVTAELYVPWHLLSSWAFRGGGFWWCAEMCGAELSLLRRPEITSVTFTPQVLP